jgi:hypothetical protein
LRKGRPHHTQASVRELLATPSERAERERRKAIIATLTDEGLVAMMADFPTSWHARLAARAA